MEDMNDDYWNEKTVVELALFLATGKESLPVLSNVKSLESTHVAYLTGFPELLNFLIRSTFLKRGKKEEGRLEDFSRKSILTTLQKDSRAMSYIDADALCWLEGRHGQEGSPSVLNEETPIDIWRQEAEKRFYQEKRINIEQLSGQEVMDFDDEFRKDILEPELSRRHGRSIRKSIIKASNAMKDSAFERADLALKSSENRELVSPELNKWKATRDYINERLKLPLGEDEEQNKLLIESCASKLRQKIINSEFNGNSETFNYFLTSEGKVPSHDEIESQIRNAIYYTLGRVE